MISTLVLCTRVNSFDGIVIAVIAVAPPHVSIMLRSCSHLSALVGATLSSDSATSSKVRELRDVPQAFCIGTPSSQQVGPQHLAGSAVAHPRDD
jgi:hypothetical protein